VLNALLKLILLLNTAMNVDQAQIACLIASRLE